MTRKANVLLPKKAGTSPATFAGALREYPTLKLFLLLFSILGVGYMLIEIALFQKLMLLIGQPQMALTVLLFSLLLGGGLGSFVSSLLRGRESRTVAFISLAVAFAVVLLSFFFPRLFGMGLSPRAASMAILIPRPPSYFWPCRRQRRAEPENAALSHHSGQCSTSECQ